MILNIEINNNYNLKIILFLKTLEHNTSQKADNKKRRKCVHIKWQKQESDPEAIQEQKVNDVIL